MRRAFGTGWALALLVSLVAVGGSAASSGPVDGTASFNVPLSAAAQDATGVPGDPGATGNASITMDFGANRICTTLSWSGIDSRVIGAHIHQGGYGQPGVPVPVVDLFGAGGSVNGLSSPARACQTYPGPELWAIAQCPAQFYVDLHSQNRPAGAIRGQLGTRCTV